MTQTVLQEHSQVSATVYTQITDVELVRRDTTRPLPCRRLASASPARPSCLLQECDGFLNYDRTNKFSAEDTMAIAKANQAMINAPF
jgi:hypothetical protein